MHLYKELDIDNLDIIIKKSIEFIELKTGLLKKQSYANWINVDSDSVFSYIPELVSAFKAYNITPIRLAFFVMHNRECVIHKDANDHLARINIPVLNCENTFTNFYTNVEYKEFTNPQTGIKSYFVSNSDYTLIDSFEIKKATLLKVQEAHNVTIPAENKLPRITMTISFNEDPVSLFNK